MKKKQRLEEETIQEKIGVKRKAPRHIEEKKEAKHGRKRDVNEAREETVTKGEKGKVKKTSSSIFDKTSGGSSAYGIARLSETGSRT